MPQLPLAVLESFFPLAGLVASHVLVIWSDRIIRQFYALNPRTSPRVFLFRISSIVSSEKFIEAHPKISKISRKVIVTMK